MIVILIFVKYGDKITNGILYMILIECDSDISGGSKDGRESKYRMERIVA